MNKILDADIKDLIPYSLVEEYKDFLDDSLRDVLKATSLRRYIEGIFDLLFKEEIINKSGITPEKWKKKNLHGHIELLRKHVDGDMGDELLNIKAIVNKGVHWEGKDPTSDEINKAISIVTTLIEKKIVRYFKKHPFGSEQEIMTLLSSLPPVKRVFILERVIEFEPKNINVVDKLSMAYLKSGNKKKAFEFIEEQYKLEVINKELYNDFISKINLLNKNLHQFKFSETIENVKEIFEQLADKGLLEQYKEFTSIMIVLLKGYSSTKHIG